VSMLLQGTEEVVYEKLQSRGSGPWVDTLGGYHGLSMLESSTIVYSKRELLFLLQELTLRNTLAGPAADVVSSRWTLHELTLPS